MTNKNTKINYTSPLSSILIDNETVNLNAKLRKIFDDQCDKINFFTKINDFFMKIYTGECKSEKLLKKFEIITRKDEITDHQIVIDKLSAFLYLVENSTEDKKNLFTFKISDCNRVDLIYSNVTLGSFNIKNSEINIIGSLLNHDSSIRCNQIEKFFIEYSHNAIIDIEQQIKIKK